MNKALEIVPGDKQIQNSIAQIQQEMTTGTSTGGNGNDTGTPPQQPQVQPQ